MTAAVTNATTARATDGVRIVPRPATAVIMTAEDILTSTTALGTAALTRTTSSSADAARLSVPALSRAGVTRKAGPRHATTSRRLGRHAADRVQFRYLAALLTWEAMLRSAFLPLRCHRLSRLGLPDLFRLDSPPDPIFALRTSLVCHFFLCRPLPPLFTISARRPLMTLTSLSCSCMTHDTANLPPSSTRP